METFPGVQRLTLEGNVVEVSYSDGTVMKLDGAILYINGVRVVVGDDKNLVLSQQGSLSPGFIRTFD